MNLLSYFLLAKSAYTTPPDIGKESTSARAIKNTTEEGLVISFPGSNNIACWLADLDIETIKVWSLGELHKGFWESLREIETELLELKPVVTCGHSEGAALAILYGAVLCLNQTPPKAIYAFEPPRVTTDGILKELFSEYGVKLVLTQNGNDVVPMVPRLIHNWQHPGSLMDIGIASEPFPNVEDHLLKNVEVSVRNICL